MACSINIPFPNPFNDFVKVVTKDGYNVDRNPDKGVFVAVATQFAYEGFVALTWHDREYRDNPYKQGTSAHEQWAYGWRVSREVGYMHTRNKRYDDLLSLPSVEPYKEFREYNGE